ncbi:DedA family protein [Ramlibacter sp. MMS24-I3-19]|uniref:DedA family protein n=1 Tax=Ramlibacter sp. MMS24-I3-19 TaxID=3416606 RepID=UPI003CFE771D
MTVLLVDWIEHYGYLAVLLGTLLEGEAILMLAGFLAHQGHLDLGAVLLIAFVAGSTGDQLFFWLGRAWGPPLLERSARLARAGEQVGTLLRCYDAALIFGIRFMYGLRIAGPIALGALGVSPRRFAVFNVLGAAVWAPLVGGAGYLSGHALEAWLGDLQWLEGLLVVLVAGGALILAVAHRWWLARPGGAPRR